MGAQLLVGKERRVMVMIGMNVLMLDNGQTFVLIHNHSRGAHQEVDPEGRARCTVVMA